MKVIIDMFGNKPLEDAMANKLNDSFGIVASRKYELNDYDVYDENDGFIEQVLDCRNEEEAICWVNSYTHRIGYRAERSM
jgi:hypothetical protein